jgi:ribosome hibernation promoting factor
MRIDYTGRKAQVSPEVRQLAERKLRKLEKVLHGITDVHVVLATDKRRQQVEVSVRSPRLSLTAAEEGADAGRSLATVIDRLTRQAQRHVGRVRETKRRRRETALWNGVVEASKTASTPSEGVRRVVRSRRFFAKPMTVDDAALQVASSEDGLLVFRDATTSRLSVLYRRKDGTLGLIEPDA